MTEYERQEVEPILEELRRQDRLWGTAFDDTHSQNDWVAFITAYAGRGMHKNPEDGDERFPTPATFDEAMIKVAALAINARRAMRRRLHGVQPA